MNHDGVGVFVTWERAKRGEEERGSVRKEAEGVQYNGQI